MTKDTMAALNVAGAAKVNGEDLSLLVDDEV